MVNKYCSFTFQNFISIWLHILIRYWISIIILYSIILYLKQVNFLLRGIHELHIHFFCVVCPVVTVLIQPFELLRWKISIHVALISRMNIHRNAYLENDETRSAQMKCLLCSMCLVLNPSMIDRQNGQTSHSSCNFYCSCLDEVIQPQYLKQRGELSSEIF